MIVRYCPDHAEALRSAGRVDTVLVTTSGELILAALAELWPGRPVVVVSPRPAARLEVLRARDLVAEPVTTKAGLRRQVLARFRAGGVGFLVLAPEQLAEPDVAAAVAASSASVLVVDEAQGVSEWSHEFLPEYVRLAAVVSGLRVRPPVLALTMTAAKRVREDIVAEFGLSDARHVAGDVDHGHVRLAVRHVDDEDGRWRLAEAEVLASQGSGLVHVADRARAEWFARVLGERGERVAVHHDAMPGRRRAEVRDAFLAGLVRVVVVAGSGEWAGGKEDVRFVVHADDPSSVDVYHQQVRRVGKDRMPGRAVLLHRPSWDAGAAEDKFDEGAMARVVRALRWPGGLSRTELARQAGLRRVELARILPALRQVGAVREIGRRALTHAAVGESDERLAELASAVFLRGRAIEHARAAMVRRYAQTCQCRRRTLLGSLGEVRGEPCGNCDNCDQGEPARGG
ncbi:RecQ family zinc-binding domain-containing protein [Amycolatopsis xylanica]|uniref:RecQ family zinc-binding domain-containing protein n=1 Tax=Amycolatopsis xylanica TaxID=589385 RepID=UPI00115FF966|nr:RecQ family zinc-binding domain-containing protein [Amycolatopsis xylanica]